MDELEWREKIRAWILAYLARPGVSHELREVAAFGALPLYSDVGGCIALRPDRRTVQVFWQRPEQSFGDAPASWRTVALVTGAEIWPELRELLPQRPEGAAHCANCEGRGRLGDQTVCGVCFGLGFVQPL